MRACSQNSRLTFPAGLHGRAFGTELRSTKDGDSPTPAGEYVMYLESSIIPRFENDARMQSSISQPMRPNVIARQDQFSNQLEQSHK